MKHFEIANVEVKVIYVKFDDAKAGRNLLHPDAIGRSNNWVPRQKIEVTFGLKKIELTHMLNVHNFP